MAPGGVYIYSIMATTDANGAYSFTRSESAQGSYDLQISFYGNTGYTKSSAMIFLDVGTLIPTTIRSLSVTNANPAVGQPFTFSGYLTDINGKALTGRTVWTQWRLPNGDWNMSEYVVTDSNGHFSATFSEQATGLYRFEFHFLGDNTYAHCGPAVEVTVGTLTSTTLTMKPSVTNPAVSQSFTLSGYLKDANGAPLAGKEILLGRQVVGQPAPGGAYDTKYTDQNGYYSFVLNEKASGTYQYATQFLGDQSYSNSWSWMSLTVGTLTPTTMTVTASTTTHAVNQKFTLSGTLKAGSTPLSGKTVKLQIKYPDGHWDYGLNTTTTDANGAYTFTISESIMGKYLFEPTFAGAGAYAPAYADIGITIGTLA